MAKGTVNKAIIVGRLGADPEVRYVPSGDAVANFNVATNQRYKDKDGNWQEVTDWHRIQVWRNRAEFAKEYLKKGMRIYVEGRIQHRSWQDQNGVQRYSTEIVASDVQMLDSPSDKSGAQGQDFNEPDLQVPDDSENAPDENVPF